VSVAGRARAQRRAARGRQFSVLMAAIVARFPFGLARIVPPTLLGFAVISSITFSVDLALLTLIHGLLGWPLPAGLTLAYLTASGLGYLLNRALNFRSHAAVGPQAAVYTVVVIINYLVCILGVGTGSGGARRGLPARPGGRRLLRNRIHVHRAALRGVPRCPAPGRSGATSRIIRRRAIGPCWHN
jgi:GtrA-like protein